MKNSGIARGNIALQAHKKLRRQRILDLAAHLIASDGFGGINPEDSQPIGRLEGLKILVTGGAGFIGKALVMRENKAFVYIIFLQMKSRGSRGR